MQASIKEQTGYALLLNHSQRTQVIQLPLQQCGHHSASETAAVRSEGGMHIG